MEKLIERVKKIILKPREAWEEIKTEETTVSGLFTRYLLILAAIPAVAGFLGRWIIGIRIPFSGVYHFSFGASLFNALVTYVLTVVGVWILGKVIFMLAPNFASVKDEVSAYKVAVYSYTPYLVAGVLNLIPSLGIIVLIAGLYSLYLLYMGLPILMKTPNEKTLAYTVLIVVTVILISILVSVITGLILRPFGPDLPRI